MLLGRPPVDPVDPVDSKSFSSKFQSCSSPCVIPGIWFTSKNPEN